MTDPTCRAIGVVLHDLSLGGTERIALRLARAWAEDGADVTVFCGRVEGALAPLIGDRVRVVEAAPAILRGPRSRGKLAEALVRMLATTPVQALFVPGNFHWPVVPRVATMRAHRPHIVAQVSAALRKPQRGSLRQWGFDRRMAHLLRGADALVAMTDTAAAQARAIVPGAAVMTIPTPALDSPMAPPVPVATGLPTIAAVGRLVPEKGFATLIAAFARCGVAKARLVIAGSGPDEARLRALAARLGVAERVTFAGYVESSRPVLDAARLFVLSSRFEGFPAVLVEALAAGRPVVATNCTPATALLARVAGAGEVVPIDDTDAMAAAIGRMLATPAPDVGALAALVADHVIEPVARDYRALFDRLCG